jgi:hypothetical protein
MKRSDWHKRKKAGKAKTRRPSLPQTPFVQSPLVPVPEKPKQGDQSPEHRPQAERQESPVPILRGGKPHAIRGLHQEVILPALFTVAMGLMIYFLQAHRYTLGLVCGFVAWVVLGAACALYIHHHYITDEEALAHTQQSPQPFSAAVEFVIGSNKRGMDSHWWVVYNRPEGLTASPAHVAMFIRLINLKPVPARIAAYSVELQNEKNEWVKLIRVSPPFPLDLYECFGTLKKCVERNEMMMHGLDRPITETMSPHDPIRGWAFFEVPEEVRIERADPARIVIRDMEGAETALIIKLEHPSLDQGEDSVQPIMLGHAGAERDLSGCQLMYWSDWMRPKQ